MADLPGTAILDPRRVRKELRRLGITQLQLARIAGLREATVSEALNGHRIEPGTLFLIAHGLTRAELGR
ncbi:MAG: helix-turn-helix transcriptional regulator [Candidatus Dormibacteraeota bacterium]|nr:helix-turn-helix transcriptional regulator [Candidatus Dormibacteraeota bacterium]